MYNFLIKRGSTIALIVGLVIVTIFLIMVGMDGSSVETLPKGEYKNVTVFDFGLYAAISLLVICTAAAILFSIYQLFVNFKNSLASVMGFGVIVVIFLVSYFASTPYNSEKMRLLMQRFEVSDVLGQVISGGIGTAITLVAISLVTIVVAEIWNVFK